MSIMHFYGWMAYIYRFSLELPCNHYYFFNYEKRQNDYCVQKVIWHNIYFEKYLFMIPNQFHSLQSCFSWYNAHVPTCFQIFKIEKLKIVNFYEWSQALSSILCTKRTDVSCSPKLKAKHWIPLKITINAL